MDEPPPLRPRHHAPVAGEVQRPDADLPADARRRRAQTAAVAAADHRHAAASPALVASAAGAIARLLLTIPRYAVAGRRRQPLRRRLPRPHRQAARRGRARDPHARRASPTASARGCPAPDGRRRRDEVVATDDFLGFSVWAEDGYVVIADDGARRHDAFVEPAAFPRYGDALVADQVARPPASELYQAPLHLQGGNVLIGDDFFFIGIDYPLLTLRGGDPHRADGQAGEDALAARGLPPLPRRRAHVRPVGTTLPVPAAAAARVPAATASTWTEELYAGNAPAPASRSSTSTCSSAWPGAAPTAATACSSAIRALAARADRRAAAAARHGAGVRRHRPRPRPPGLRRHPQRRCRSSTPTTRTRALRSWYFATANNCLVARSTRTPADRLPPDIRATARSPHARRHRRAQRGDLGGARLRRPPARRLPPVRVKPRGGALHQEVPGALLTPRVVRLATAGSAAAGNR